MSPCGVMTSSPRTTAVKRIFRSQALSPNRLSVVPSSGLSMWIDMPTTMTRSSSRSATSIEPGNRSTL